MMDNQSTADELFYESEKRSWDNLAGRIARANLHYGSPDQVSLSIDKLRAIQDIWHENSEMTEDQKTSIGWITADFDKRVNHAKLGYEILIDRLGPQPYTTQTNAEKTRIFNNFAMILGGYAIDRLKKIEAIKRG